MLRHVRKGPVYLRVIITGARYPALEIVRYQTLRTPSIVFKSLYIALYKVLYLLIITAQANMYDDAPSAETNNSTSTLSPVIGLV